MSPARPKEKKAGENRNEVIRMAHRNAQNRNTQNKNVGHQNRVAGQKLLH
jgi:hypothetical protein